jgi:hypothetical protein
MQNFIKSKYNGYPSPINKKSSGSQFNLNGVFSMCLEQQLQMFI